MWVLFKEPVFQRQKKKYLKKTVIFSQILGFAASGFCRGGQIREMVIRVMGNSFLGAILSLFSFGVNALGYNKITYAKGGSHENRESS